MMFASEYMLAVVCDVVQELLKAVDVCEPKVHFLQVNGESLLAKMPAESTTGLRQSLDTLKIRWDNIQDSAAGRRSQLDEALRTADSFQDRLNRAMTWLNSIEQTVNSLSPVSRILSTLAEQRHQLQVSILNDHFSLGCSGTTDASCAAAV